MVFWKEDSNTYKHWDNVMNAPEEHKASLGIDAITAAIAYEGAKRYQEHEKKNGKPESHEMAKDLLAASIAGAASHLFQTKGMDTINRVKVEHAAREHAAEHVAAQYRE